MAARSIFISGFGPFEEVLHNASGELAGALAAEPPQGVAVHGQRLPVSFDRSAEVLEQALEGLQPELLIGLGEQPAHGFRLELRAARGSSRLTRPDVDGTPAGRSGWSREPGSSWHDDLWTPIERQLRGFVRSRPHWMLSVGAGGYVCERVYRWLLEEGQRRGVPALFVHVPPLSARGLEVQLEELRALLLELQL